MGNQGQNMFTILLSPMEFLFLKKCVNDLFPCNKTTKYVRKFKDMVLCICKEEIHMRYSLL